MFFISLLVEHPFDWFSFNVGVVYFHLLTSSRQFVWVRGQGFEVIRNGLEMCDLPQHRNLPSLNSRYRDMYHIYCNTHTDCNMGRLDIVLILFILLLTTTGCSKATKQQNLCRSSTRAFLKACFSVSSSSMYLSLTSCIALSNWG